ncbi:MAG: ferric reductase-like transmembrane domain-containing protein [Gemmatimonadales bacterium]|nr:ferric reductase-like transmembrane domain-containing protein [Gemmatimonadales bacterium]
MRRHLAILAGSIVAGSTLVMVLTGGMRERLSLASAYVALALLAITLSLGPLNVLRGRSNPVSFHRRRDFGIWSAVFGLLHTGIGLTVHLRGKMWQYFLPTDDSPRLLGLRADLFGAANYAGLAAVFLLVLLSAISNDRALRSLGVSRWRGIQRWAYPLLALTVVHGALYQMMERRGAALVITFAALVVAVVGLQLARRRRGETRRSPA